MQKLNMIQAFHPLAEGEDATFTHPEGQTDQSRLIKMRINAPQGVNLYITPVVIDYATGLVVSHDEEATRFLAHVDAGFDQLEFYYQGSFCLSALGGGIWLDTVDNTSFSVEASDLSNYARLWEREERDPRILEIERAARHNQNKLREEMAADMAAYKAQMEEVVRANTLAAQTPASSGTPSVSGEKPVPTGNPADNPPATGVGTEGATGAPDDKA